MDVFLALKQFVKDHGLVGSVWVTRARCLGFCNDLGATVVIYPNQKWFTHVTLDDVPQITTLLYPQKDDVL